MDVEAGDALLCTVLLCQILTATDNLRIFATLRGVPNRNAMKDALDLVGLPYDDKKRSIFIVVVLPAPFLPSRP